MSKSLWLLSTALVALTSPAFAQVVPAEPTTPTATETGGAVASPADDAAQAAAENPGEIVVTATRRSSPLSDVPIAVSAITAESLQNTGASDIRQLNQISPSLFVSSSSTEATGGGAGIRGIRTVGDNPGLESSVATFIDGVYRSRAGVGLTELGPIERIEILRGPQGTLFGRNASAGLINVVTARPKFEEEGYAEASYGNYEYRRFGLGFTGPIGEKIAYRLDGTYVKRDGFVKDIISGRDVNDRDRWLVRGKLLLKPTDDLSILLIGDYARRKEECCAAPYLTAENATRNADGSITTSPSTVANIIRTTTSVVPGAGVGIVQDNTYSRRVTITPGQDFQSNVRDWGGSAEVNYDLGGAALTSITAYRDWKYVRGQDADFSNLDLLNRLSDGNSFTRFRTFSQELRLQGKAFGDRLDWLVGGYYANERLDLGENTKYGADYDQYIAKVVRANGVATGSALLAGFPGFAALQQFAVAAGSSVLATDPRFASVPAGARGAIATRVAAEVQGFTLAGTGIQDRFRQKSRNYALFTHNIFDISDRLSLTLGARYTNERKTLDATLTSNSNCGVLLANIARLNALAAAAAVPGAAAVVSGLPASTNVAVAGLASGLAGSSGLAALAGAACGPLSNLNGTGTSRKKEGEWSGTSVLSYKLTDRLLTYASFSRGYKAGGFNLDRAPLFNGATLTGTTDLSGLQFAPEKVDAFELGAKFDGRRFDLNVAAFYQRFKNFQLNTFNGTNFFVTNINGCKTDLGTTDSDMIAGNSACADTRSGVVSKGVEVEAFMYPASDMMVSAGFTYADTRYRDDLVSTANAAGNNSLQPALSLLPGARLSNSSQYVVTGSATYTPAIGGALRGLLYVDFRYTSEINTGSDLFVEKNQPGVMVVNARIGIGGADRGWSLELWSQNLLDEDYQQIGFGAPLQGSNNSRAQLAAGQTTTQLFGGFLGEPRTFGVTARTKF